MTADRVMCGNEYHEDEESGPVPAVWRVEWPNGPYLTQTACDDCLDIGIDLAREEGRTVLLIALAAASRSSEEGETDA